MRKGLEIPGFTALFVVATVMALLCYAQTAQAEENPKDKAHSTEESEAKGADAEVIRSSFEALPVPVLSEVAKSLARSKSDLSKEDFSKIVDEALKKAEEKPSDSSKEAAEKLKKTFEEQREQLGAETGPEFGAAAAEELARRIKAEDTKPSEPGEKPSDKPTQTADKPKDDKKIDPIEGFRKQLEEFAQKLEKEKEEALKKADQGRGLNPADLAKALGGGKGKGEGGGSGSGGGDSGGGSGGGSPPSPQASDDSQEQQPKPEDTSSAGEKLRNLADLLSQSTADTSESDSSDSDDSDEDSSKSAEASKAKIADIMEQVAESDAKAAEAKSETETEIPKDVAATQPPAEQFGPPVPTLPAKTSLPTIPSNGPGAATNAAANAGGDFPGGQGFAGGGVSGPSGSGGNGFTDTIFNGLGYSGGGEPGGKITYKYSRTGSETYGSSSGGTSSESSSEGSGYSSGSKGFVSTASVGMWPTSSEESAPAHTEGGNGSQFSFISSMVGGMCSTGSLNCKTTLEKQQ